MTGTYERHIAAIRHTVTRSNIIGIRKALNAYERASRGYSVSLTCPDWTLAQIDAILTDTARYAPVITGEWHGTGIATLQRAVKRYPDRFNAYRAAVVADIWYFRLVDWHCEDGLHYYPVIRAIARDGAHFDFYNIPWQSGGDGPEIVPSAPYARVKPLWYCTIAYRTASGKRVCYGHKLASDSWYELQTELLALLAHRRRDAKPIDGTFRAEFMTMQIGSN